MQQEAGAEIQATNASTYINKTKNNRLPKTTQVTTVLKITKKEKKNCSQNN